MTLDPVKYNKKNEDHNDGFENKILIDDLLTKCEVANLPMVYAKYIDRVGGICTFPRLLQFNSYFTEENIQRDLEKIEHLIAISVYPSILAMIDRVKDCRNSSNKQKITEPSLQSSQGSSNVQKNDSLNVPNEPFTPIKCLVNQERLGLIINLYRNKRLIPKSSSLEELAQVFHLRNAISTKKKFLDMLNRLTKKPGIYGIVYSSKRKKESTNEIKADDVHVTNTEDMNSAILLNDLYLRISGKFLHPTNRKLFIQLIGTVFLGGSITMLLLWLTKSMR